MNEIGGVNDAPFEPWIPPALHGQAMVVVHGSAVRDDDEWVWATQFICNRKLFGFSLDILLPDLFGRFGDVCGALVIQEVPSHLFEVGMVYPGDVDLLIVPYSDGRLWLSDTVSAEIKIVRALFAKQGRSPNQLGISQARGLLSNGFPHAAVIHLITSDTSPPNAWRELARTHVLDSEGRCGPLEPVIVDTLPAALIDRASGRLKASIGADPAIGHVAAYVNREQGYWLPTGGAARSNRQASLKTMNSVEQVIRRFPEAVINVPSRPPVSSADQLCPPMILDRRRLIAAR